MIIQCTYIVYAPEATSNSTAMSFLNLYTSFILDGIGWLDRAHSAN